MLYYKLKSFFFSLLRISNIDDIRQPSQNTNAATSVSYFIPPRRQRSNSYPNFRSEDHLHSNTGQTTLSSTHPVRLYLSNSSGQRNVPVTSTRAAGTRDFFLFSPFFLRFFFTFFFFFRFCFLQPEGERKIPILRIFQSASRPSLSPFFRIAEAFAGRPALFCGAVLRSFFDQLQNWNRDFGGILFTPFERQSRTREARGAATGRQGGGGLAAAFLCAVLRRLERACYAR